MLKVRGAEVRIEDFSGLIRGDPLSWVLKGLRELAEKAFLERNYFSSLEPWLSSFEEAIYKLDPKLYDIIIKVSFRPTQVDKVMNLSRYALVILDGLSFREAFLLDRDFNQWNLNLKYSCAPLPTDTKFFTVRYLGAESPSELKRRKNLPFHFEHIASKEDLSGIGPLTTDKVVVWVREPDKTLHEFRERFRTSDLSQAYAKTRIVAEALINILLERFQEVHVTSDHGYITDPHSWRSLEDFPSDMRYALNVPESIKPYCKKCGDYWVLLGRFNTVKRGRHSNIRHGGLSVVEALTPFITIAKPT